MSATPSSLGFLSVRTTSHRGSTPEEVASRCADKIIAIADTANPVIRDQALAFKGQLETVLAVYMREAIKGDRTTIYNVLIKSGNPELAEHIRSM